MARLYGILAIIGWAWAIIVAIALPMILARRNRKTQRGFDVGPTHEKHL